MTNKKTDVSSNKLTQEELQEIASIQNNFRNLLLEYGQIEVARKDLESRTQNADRLLQTYRNQEQEVARSLEEKYGKGSVDLESGTFIPVA